MIPDSYITNLLQSVNIVDLIKERVDIKKKGKDYHSCCPFHTEKSPSFTVSESKQFYHCFGCGAHGDAIGFIREIDGLDFKSAVEQLSDRMGFSLPTGKDDDSIKETFALKEANKKAANFYYETMKNQPSVVEYLMSRSVGGKTAAKFLIGYSKDEWQFLKGAFPDYESNKSLVEAGLVKVSDSKNVYDSFRDRVIFPIFDIRGDVIGFGGRVFPKADEKKDVPKYINSTETPIFQKGNELYGLFQSKDSIKNNNQSIVVEGYMMLLFLTDLALQTL